MTPDLEADGTVKQMLTWVREDLRDLSHDVKDLRLQIDLLDTRMTRAEATALSSETANLSMNSRSTKRRDQALALAAICMTSFIGVGSTVAIILAAKV